VIEGELKLVFIGEIIKHPVSVDWTYLLSLARTSFHKDSSKLFCFLFQKYFAWYSIHGNHFFAIYDWQTVYMITNAVQVYYC